MRSGDAHLPPSADAASAPDVATDAALGRVPAVPDPAVPLAAGDTFREGALADSWSSEGAAEAPPEHADAGVAARHALDRRVMAVVEGMSDAFLAIGPDWRVTYANRQAARLNGTTPDALVGRSHWEQWPPTVGSEVERQYRRVVSERTSAHFEHHYEGAGVWHEIRAYPADDGGLAVFYRDVTAQKQLEAERARQARALSTAYEQALAAETQFRLLVDRVTDYAIFLMDPDGIITQWGQGAERLKGWAPNEAIGLHLRDCYPQGGAEDGTADEHLRHAALRGEYIGEGSRLRKDGTLFAARVVLTALRRGGELVGFSKITQDLTGEREREAALERVTAAAEAANVAKSEFLANTSHEIRTPLNAVMGYAELLDTGLAGQLDDRQRQYVKRIRDTSRHLLSLVNDVLDLAKIEAGEMRTSPEPGLVGDAVVAALQLVEPQAAAREVTIANACVGSPGAAYYGDPERVRQIVTNLLSNAVRFTEQGGRVTVMCGAAEQSPRGLSAGRDGYAGPWTYIRVEDTGVGISPDQLERIWEAFVQVDTSRTRRFGGSGLGLTISRHLARLMGGDITVTSQAGLGSSFVLWLPAGDAGAVPEGRELREEAAPVTVAAQAPEDALAEVGPAGAAGLREIADALLTELERVLATWVARLRADPGTPSARGLSDSEIEDHSVTFLADLAQGLTVVGQDGPEAVQMLRDGSAIQRLIARRHGVQRARLGWRESEVRREYELLREELHAAVRRRISRGGAREVERALEMINHFLDQAERESIGAFRAGGDPGGG
ncbi:MAG TPA: PAS domain-containing protein [Gemmatimonadaceae bacterium]|nr:PAS domain-containing protein [Gemmatimonadaceae bacterium]